MDRDQWLAQVTEEILEPDLPICDPHHHLWDHPSRRYLIDELLADTGSGHRVASTVFVECASMYRAGGPAATTVRDPGAPYAAGSRRGAGRSAGGTGRTAAPGRVPSRRDPMMKAVQGMRLPRLGFRMLALLVAGVVLTSCGNWKGIGNVPVPGGPGTGRDAMSITVLMPETLALNVNSRVRVADVFVGTVRAIALTKRALNAAWERDLDGALEYEAHLQDMAGRSKDHAEGMAAFLEKRAPQFHGR